MARKKKKSNKWYKMDLHIHTPASSDYQEPNVTYLDILRQAETKKIDLLAFTDHNSVAGYRRMQEEIEQLELLERLNRLLPEEEVRLKEYRRLLDKIVIFPGFEFTATFGFHILGIFPQDKSPREIEHILMDLNIPAEKLDEGSVTVGASSDVLTVYKKIKEGGGIAIAAHANSNHGVAMRGFPFGGQTKIAYTQDANLSALEVTDLERRGKRTTKAFFNGSKPEYPRQMHCIQGSDAHRLQTDMSRRKNLGVGDRATDILISEISFEELEALFESNDFARTRPHRATAEPEFDFISSAREEGQNIVQDFHASMTVRGGYLYSIIANICAFANTNGGTLYIGIDPENPQNISGVSSPQQSINKLEQEISKRISPPINCTLDSHKTSGKNIVRVLVPRGDDPPYAVDENKIYIRTESETGLAVRDEIVELVLRAKHQPPSLMDILDTNGDEGAGAVPLPATKVQESSPRTGVEVVESEKRRGVEYFTLRDLRNGNVVKNVTEKSARKLWHQAILRYQDIAGNPQKIDAQWQGNLGIMRKYNGKYPRYDLIQRTDGGYRYYFGVTDDGIHGLWKEIVGLEE